MQRCRNCGTTLTIAEIRRKHPDALSCCPERDMQDFDLDDIMRRLERLERTVLELNPGLNWKLEA